ncbi:hypothetical protein APHAL10511_005530, partial [Amanita phalloides]
MSEAADSQSGSNGQAGSISDGLGSDHETTDQEDDEVHSNANIDSQARRSRSAQHSDIEYIDGESEEGNLIQDTESDADRGNMGYMSPETHDLPQQQIHRPYEIPDDWESFASHDSQIPMVEDDNMAQAADLDLENETDNDGNESENSECSDIEPIPYSEEEEDLGHVLDLLGLGSLDPDQEAQSYDI